MKKYCILFTAAMIVLASCGNPSANAGAGNSDSSALGSKDTLRDSIIHPDSNALKGAVPDKIADSFVMKASMASMMESITGQLADDQAFSARVKAFGNMMVKDHNAANEKLKAIAGAKAIPVATVLSEEMNSKLRMLKTKTGKEFDKIYMAMMLEDHKKAISLFENASATLHDPELRIFASSSLPILKMHLDSVNAIRGNH